MYYYDPTYLISAIVVLPAFIFALICQAKVKSNYNKYSKVMSMSGMTGAQAAYRLLQCNGITDVRINCINGELTDHYDPRTKCINLSQGVYNSASVAAIGIACHEAGHACQHAEAYSPLTLRNAVIPMTRIGSTIGIPICIIGLFINSPTIAYVGVILYSLVALFQLLTLPVEFNASSRALATIEANNFLVGEEYSGAKKVLTAAALTYVASLATALATILRLLLVINRRR